MKGIGFSTGVVGRDSNSDRMVKAIMDKSGCDSEFVKLTDFYYPIWIIEFMLTIEEINESCLMKCLMN